MEHAGGAGGRARKDELEQQGDKAGRECRGDDAADDIVNGGSILVLGAVDLERADLGSRGALGVLGDVRVHGAGDVGVFAQDELVGPNLNIALDGAIDSHRIARKRCRLGRAAQGNRLAYRIETVGGAVGIEHDMLAGNGHAAINRSLGNVDGARRKTNGAAHRAVADGESIARGDDIAVDGRIVQVEGLTCPVQVTFDAGRIGVIVGRKYVACGVRASERRRGKCGERQRDECEQDGDAAPCFTALGQRELITGHSESFVRCSICI